MTASDISNVRREFLDGRPIFTFNASESLKKLLAASVDEGQTGATQKMWEQVREICRRKLGEMN